VDKKTMKKKIIGLLVCMLFIATAVPAVESLKIKDLNIIPTNIAQASNRVNWNETQKLIASDGAAEDLFGYSVSFDGDTLLIGAYSDDEQGINSGSVYVFTWNGTAWEQQAKLLASDGAAGDKFGYTVFVDGSLAIIGAPWDDDKGEDSGSAYVFILFEGVWRQQQKLIASDGTAGDNFGMVSLDENTAIVGAPWNDGNGKDSGAAYVFTLSGEWKEQTKLFSLDSSSNDLFGESVYLDGDSVLIGAPHDDDNGVDSGSVYVFTGGGSSWSLQTKILATGGVAGDNFGTAVSLSGNTALIGAPMNDDNGVDSGAAYVFTRTGSTWTQQKKLLASDDSGSFGSSVSQDVDYAVIGAPQSQSAYVFLRTSWSQETKLVASDGGATFSYFGQSVSVCGDIAVIGAPYDDDNGVRSGSAYMYISQSATYDLAFEVKGGLGVKLKITNNGNVDATDVNWQVHIEGGALKRINKTMDDTVDILVGKTQTVRTGLLIGFGSITITARVIHDEKIVEGKQFIIFTVVS